MYPFISVLLLLLCATLQTFAQDDKSAAAAPYRSHGALPTDIYPETHSRLPLARREDLDAQARKGYDDFMASFPGAGPGMGAAIRLQGYRGNIVQVDSPLGPALMQLAILTTAREHDQPYEWSLHELQAIAVGLDPAIIEVLKNRKPLAKLDPKQAVIVRISREIFGSHQLSSATYERAITLLGKSNLVDVIGLMSDYTRTSTTLTAFNQQMPPGWRQLLPLPFVLPGDIHPDSRSRLPLIAGPSPPFGPGSFQSALYGRELSPKGTGPTSIRRHGAGLKALDASVGHRPIDLAILVTAREHDAQYDWTVNELAAIQDGVDPALIDAIRNRKPVASLASNDACLIQFGRELFGKHFVSSEIYSTAVKVFGEQNLVDLVDVMALHAKEAMLLAAFDQHLPENQKPLLPARER